MTGGSVRIVDPGGVTRLEIRADRDDAALTWNTVFDADSGDQAFDVAALDAGTGLVARVNSQTGVPAGEQPPPHGLIRRELIAPKTCAGLIERRMKWIYDLGELRNPVGC